MWLLELLFFDCGWIISFDDFTFGFCHHRIIIVFSDHESRFFSVLFASS